jgi:hypothetical protein
MTEARHGSRSMFVLLKRAGLPVCPGCVEANNRYKREYRARGKCEPDLGWPLLPTARRRFEAPPGRS